VLGWEQPHAAEVGAALRALAMMGRLRSDPVTAAAGAFYASLMGTWHLLPTAHDKATEEATRVGRAGASEGIRVEDWSGALLVALGVGLVRLLPRRAGYGLARWVARRMAQRRSRLFCTLCANLAHVLGPQAEATQLGRLAEQVLTTTGRVYVDMFQATVEDLRRNRVGMQVDQHSWEVTQSTFGDGRGVILVGPHMASSDLAMQWLLAQGIAMQGLGLAAPDWSTRLMHRFRRQRGMEVVPLSLGALRAAYTRLQGGGAIFVGVDRPIAPGDDSIPFFDAPARLPIGYIRLALQTRSRIVAMCCVRKSDGSYHLSLSPPLEMERVGDLAQSIRHNARRVLAILEAWIRETPEQWAMFVPVWSEEDARAVGGKEGQL
jgi:lauroyl/myristoyl acyltransferase